MTGSIQNAPIVEIRYPANEMYHYAMTNKTVSTINKNTPVKVSAGGGVEPVTAATDIVIGYAYTDILAGKVGTIVTVFKSIVRAQSTSSVTAGVEISNTGFNSTDKFFISVASTTGDFVSGVALNNANANAPFALGILVSPYKK